MQKKLNELYASALAPLLARREISAEQLVQACLDRAGSSQCKQKRRDTMQR